MRTIINISLPYSLKREVDKEIQKGHFASKSEFFRHLFRLWKDNELIRDVAESKQEFKEGKGKILNSLSDIG